MNNQCTELQELLGMSLEFLRVGIIPVILLILSIATYSLENEVLHPFSRSIGLQLIVAREMLSYLEHL